MRMSEEERKDYEDVTNILAVRFLEVSGEDFYRDLFPHNQKAGELDGDYSRPNAVYLYRPGIGEGKSCRLRRRIMLDDTWSSDYETYVWNNNMTLCSGLAYRGRANKLENAREMHALIIDLDGVGRRELENLFLRFDLSPQHVRSLPRPTYLVASGTGLHIYYVFNTPIFLYPNIKVQFKNLKYNLTFRIWDYKGTSKKKEVQYQSINQGFRMVGSINDKYNVRVRAFLIGNNVTLENLNAYCDAKSRVDISKRFHAVMTLDTAKKEYPEWYMRRIVKGEPRGHWICNRAVYNWWLRQIDKVVGGHRYFYLMCLAIYACKCGVPRKELRRDMNKLFLQLSRIQHDNVFTREDVASAMEMYSRDYYCYTINDIEKVSGIRIEKNKRNGRPQLVHLKRIRALQNINYPEGEWRNKNGRPKKDTVVENWRKLNPNGRKCDCARATGLSRQTVYKYWK